MSRQVVIEAEPASVSEMVRELLGHRDLLWVFAHRDYRVRYAQTLLGYGWAILQPLLTLGIFVVVFGSVLRVDPGGPPYPLFAMAGMIAWSYFSVVVAQAGSSVIGAQSMVKKIYFPRLVVPLSKGLVGLVDLIVGLSLYGVLMVWYGVYPQRSAAWLPALLLTTVVISLAIGIWLSALTVRYRDFQHVIPFLLQMGVYATPIAYPMTLVPEAYRWWFYLNPMTGVVEGFRWCLLGGPPPVVEMAIAAGVGVVLLASGLAYFRSVERIIADVL